MNREQEPCPHIDVRAWSFADGVPVAWSCDNCHLRFYPACVECVDIGHRAGEHPAPVATDVATLPRPGETT